MSTDMTSTPSSTNKKPRRRSKAKKSGPTLSDLITKIVSSSKERTGVSLVALKKALAANGYDVARNNSRIKLAVKRLVANGKLIQTKGTGASGSFKIGTKSVKAKKPKAKKATRKKPKKAKKPAGTKKTPKKSRKKSLKSPAKANETVETEKTKRPKRTKRRASKTKK